MHYVNSQTKQVVFNALFIFFSIAVLPYAVAAKQDKITSDTNPDEKTFYVIEPVFNSRSFILEAGDDELPDLILIHGVGEEASQIWNNLIPDLTGRFHVIAFDLPGFGKSDKANLLYDPKSYSRFIDWIIDKYTHGPVTLLGHSMGGTQALYYTAHHDDRVAKLVLVGSSGVLHRAIFTKKATQVDTSGNRRSLFYQLVKKPAKKIFNSVASSAVDSVEDDKSDKKINRILQNENLRKVFLGGSSSAIAAMASSSQDFSGLFSKINTPTLLIWGDEDDVAPLRVANVLRSKLSNARLITIEEAGHLPMADQKKSFLDILFNAEIISEKNDIPEGEPVEASCVGKKRRKVLTGNFTTIKVNKCEKLHIENARAERIEVIDSNVFLDNVVIDGEEVGIETSNSTLTATVASVKADIAIKTSNSKFDLAGVELSGKTAAIYSKDQSKVLFSVSTLESPLFTGNIHGVKYLSENESL